MLARCVAASSLQMPQRAERLVVMAKKIVAEKIRAARHINVRLSKLNAELKALKDELLEEMEIGETVIVDDCKTTCYETTRTTIDRKALEAWLAKQGMEIPAEFIKSTTSVSIRL